MESEGDLIIEFIIVKASSPYPDAAVQGH